MNTLYIDCSMGAAGDMLTGALLELMPSRDDAVRMLDSMGIPGIRYEAADSTKCGVTGTHVTVTYNGEEEVTEDGCAHDHPHAHSHGHAHSYDHEHSHEHSHEHAHSHDQNHSHEHGSDVGRAHEHSHAHVHGTDAGHVHAHDSDTGHSREHVHTHDHSHTRGMGMSEISDIISSINVPDDVKRDIMGVYGIIAEAESQAHGVPVSEVHFHEVGSMDAVADAAAVCLLIRELSPDSVKVSDIHVGSGTVICAHGELPVPAPATANILEGLPTYSDGTWGELCTPTGAAILRYFGTEFGAKPAPSSAAIIRTGRGMGRKDFDRPNCVTIHII